MEIGYLLSVLGAAIVATLSGAGSALGVSFPGRAANGLLSEEPEKFGNTLILVALPGSQGIYGFISGVVVLIGPDRSALAGPRLPGQLPGASAAAGEALQPPGRLCDRRGASASSLEMLFGNRESARSGREGPRSCQGASAL